MIVVVIITVYLFLVWVIIRLVVPHLGFVKGAIPKTIPDALRVKIEEYSAAAKSDTEFLTLAYTYVTDRYTGSRTKTLTYFWRAFGDVYQKMPGFLPCTGQNYLLRTMLVKSGRFSEDDIKVVVVPFNFFIHQYLRVYCEGKWVNVDPRSYFLGKKLGQRSTYFG